MLGQQLKDQYCTYFFFFLIGKKDNILKTPTKRLIEAHTKHTIRAKWQAWEGKEKQTPTSLTTTNPQASWNAPSRSSQNQWTPPTYTHWWSILHLQFPQNFEGAIVFREIFQIAYWWNFFSKGGEDFHIQFINLRNITLLWKWLLSNTKSS